MSEQNNVIYGLAHNGDLMWFRHNGNGDGSFRLARNEGKKVGNGWNFKQVFSGGDGIIYAITQNNDLMWARHQGRNDGSFNWTSEMKKVGSGWNFKQVFSGGDGIIYAIMHNGDLMWAHHEGRNDGSFRWTSEMKKVGNGWNFKQVFSGGGGIIYAITDNGDLLWARHEGRNDGSFRWTSEMKKVDTGWDFRHVFSGSDGVIYAINRILPPVLVGGAGTGGELLWYRHEGRNDGSARWAANSGKQVGDSWAAFSTVFSGEDGYHVYGPIGDKYAQLGGPDSWLGWPTSDEQPFPQDGRVRTFENGAIYWWLDTGAIELGNISLQYKGLYCFGETDELSSADEPYVIFGVVPTPPARASEVMTQIYSDVDAGDSRPDTMELYRGLPYGMALGVALMENDQGDPNKYLEQIKRGVAVAGTGVTAGCAAIPYVGPAVALGCAAMWEEFGPEIVKFVNSVLGTGDDLIEKWVWQVTAKEMVTMAHAPRLNFWGIEHHLESKLLSDGEASYKVYLGIYAV